MTFLLPILLRWGLSQRVAGVLAWVLPVVGGVLLLGGLWAFLGARENADDRRNQEVGAEMQRASDMASTIDRVEEGNKAREEITAPGPAGDRARYDQCLRSARTPANCARYAVPK